ncbi:hypothetical protein [uncultured Winogradskyella sp.]|uniref:hypothetical protein n=1 Tax=uncultured Winogradskyella sp. TaxID=395353 RepID=UPI00260F927D|nr:hypothetical protein [uncultured Winogradskyella sp.]
MTTKKWISILSYLKTIAILLWAFTFLSHQFNWFENVNLIATDSLKDFRNLAVVLYMIVYLIELRLTVKEKTIEIAKLKTKLSHYEN